MTEAATIDDLLKTQLAAPEFHMFALGLFAFVAVLLAGVGVFGVLGAFVAERTGERRQMGSYFGPTRHHNHHDESQSWREYAPQ